MHITILASGSRGDVQPYVALGQGLCSAGYEVRLVTHRNFESLSTAPGVEFFPLEGDVEAIAQSQEMQKLLDKGNFLAIMAEMGKQSKLAARQLAASGLAACRGTDLILGGLGGLFVGLALAEKLDRPFIQAYYFPFTPTSAFPSVLLPRPMPGLRGPFNRLSHVATRQTMWQSFRAADNLARREVLGLSAAPFLGPFKSSRYRQYPVLYGYSPAVLPPPADWPASAHVTGYWFLDAPTDWAPPDELMNFLQAGPPPVYIGFGSMSTRNAQATTAVVLEALARTQQRAIMQSGWGGLHKTDLPDSALMIDSVPHTWLFPRMAAVVHHGGAGTTSAGLRAGVPSIIIPFFGDQPFWGRRVAELGVGPAPIPQKQLTADRLAQAIQIAVTDQSMRQKAAELGSKIRAENGIAQAVAVLQQVPARSMN
jgi:sterol 3beta-glucosyltransferase